MDRRSDCSEVTPECSKTQRISALPAAFLCPKPLEEQKLLVAPTLVVQGHMYAFFQSFWSAD